MSTSLDKLDGIGKLVTRLFPLFQPLICIIQLKRQLNTRYVKLVGEAKLVFPEF